MNVKHVILTFLSLVLLGFASCEKEDNDDEELSTAEMIQAKWNVKSWILERHRDGQDSSWKIDFDDDDFWDIRPNNKIYRMNGSTISDTLGYILLNDTTMLVEFAAIQSTYTIQTLTDNTLKLYAKEPFTSNPDNYYADTWNLSK